MKTFKLSIFYRNAMFFSVMAIFMILFSFVIITNHNHFPIPIQMTLFILSLMPVIFIKKIRSLFIKDVSIQLNPTELLFDQQHKKLLRYSYSEIKSYQIEFPSSEIKCIKLKFRNGRNQNFSFLDNLKKPENNPIEFIEEISHLLNQQRITIEPSFFATKKGLLLIYIFGLLILVEIALGILVNNKISALALINIALIIQFSSQRNIELKMYEKWHK